MRQESQPDRGGQSRIHSVKYVELRNLGSDDVTRTTLPMIHLIAKRTEPLITSLVSRECSATRCTPDCSSPLLGQALLFGSLGLRVYALILSVPPAAFVRWYEESPRWPTVLRRIRGLPPRYRPGGQGCTPGSRTIATCLRLDRPYPHGHVDAPVPAHGQVQPRRHQQHRRQARPEAARLRGHQALRPHLPHADQRCPAGRPTRLPFAVRTFLAPPNVTELLELSAPSREQASRET